MIGKKSGKYCIKKFVLVSTKAEFDSLNGAPQCYFEQRKEKCQQEIIVPGYKLIQPVFKPKNQIIPINYIKTFAIQQIMGKQKYQLDSTDVCFITQNFPFLTQQQFKSIVVSLEKQSFKYGYEINQKKIIQRIINQPLSNFNKQHKETVIKDIFNYWKNKRKNIRSPMLRLFWQKNQMGPFKCRQENEHLFLRNRTVKVENSYIKQILQGDLQALLKLLNLMQKRQNQQKLLIHSQTQSFQKLCKHVLKKVTNNQIPQIKKSGKFQITQTKKRTYLKRCKKSLNKNKSSAMVSKVKIYQRLHKSETQKFI